MDQAAHLRYHLDLAEKHIKTIKATAAGAMPCESEQIVKDAAQLMVQEAQEVLNLACQALENCLTQQ